METPESSTAKLSEVITGGASIETIATLMAIAAGSNPAPTKATEGETFITVPGGTKTLRLPVHRITPERKTGIVKFMDQKDFCAFVKEHKDDDQSRMFIQTPDNRSLRVTAVFDYHQTKPTGKAAWGEFRAVLDTRVSDEFRPWMDKAGDTGLDQSQFADFIDDMNATVANPDGATLIEMAIALKGSVGATFESKMNRQIRGDQTLHFQQETNVGDVKIPTEILLYCPVFQGGQNEHIKVKLQYSIQQGRPRFFFRIPALAKIFDDAARRAKDVIADETGLPVYAAEAPTPAPRESVVEVSKAQHPTC